MSLRAVLACGTAILVLAGACSGDDPGAVVNKPEETTPTPTASERTDAEPTTDPEPTESPSRATVPTVTETVTTGLTSPWGLAFLPNGDALVSERDTGLIKRVAGDGSRVTRVGEIPEADPSSEGGLLGLAVHPEYPDEPWVYAYYSTDVDNRVVRMRYEGGSLGPQQLLLDGIAVAEIHNGGRLAFGPDGLLYVTTGDGSEGDRSQDRTSLNGKILRLDPDGSPAEGNPFGDQNPVFSYGHRNVQGITWDDAGNLFASEFGQNTWDELNHIQAGDNFGWPAVEGKVGDDSGYVDPIVQWATEEASPSGITWAAGSVWMTGLRGERLWQVEVTENGSVSGDPQAYLTGEYGRLRTVERAPDGSLWLTTSNTDGRATPNEGDDRILRLRLR
jgi:glucose/arabinose dehydrogenase